MPEDIKKAYTDFHKKNKSNHLYPTEWVIRTMLGNYPGLHFDRSKYPGGKILDLGFGDGRNMSLLSNCGLEIYGVEITQGTLDIAAETLANINVQATLKVGTNTDIPFDDNFFDYVLASSSCYYVDGKYTFADNLKEMTRVLKPGGYMIANFPVFPTNFIFENSIPAEEGHVIIQNDIYGIRNGYKFKAFSSNEEIIATLSEKYEDISLGNCIDNYYGVRNHAFISTAKKK